MFCERCGSKLPDGANFCENCGEKIVLNTAEPISTNQAVPPNYTVPPNYSMPNIQNNYVDNRPKNSKSKLVVILILALVIFIALISVVAVKVLIPLIQKNVQKIQQDIGSTEENNNEALNDNFLNKTDNKDVGNEIKDTNKDENQDIISVEDDEDEDDDTDSFEHSSNDEYVIPDSDSRYISFEDLIGLSKYECRIARNEIFARYGRKFDDENLQNYFNNCSWYYPMIESKDFDDSWLSDIEIKNMNTIINYEKEQGYR